MKILDISSKPATMGLRVPHVKRYTKWTVTEPDIWFKKFFESFDMADGVFCLAFLFGVQGKGSHVFFKPVSPPLFRPYFFATKQRFGRFSKYVVFFLGLWRHNFCNTATKKNTSYTEWGKKENNSPFYLVLIWWILVFHHSSPKWPSSSSNRAGQKLEENNFVGSFSRRI